MSTIIDYNGSLHLFIKGASELVLASCSQWLNNLTGQVESITP
jgi:magnesium-transporting ATPase (P-type)